MRRSQRLLSLVPSSKALSLSNPRLSISDGREAVGFLDKIPEACDPNLVNVTVLFGMCRS
jgi:hypothetical protein